MVYGFLLFLECLLTDWYSSLKHARSTTCALVAVIVSLSLFATHGFQLVSCYSLLMFCVFVCCSCSCSCCCYCIFSMYSPCCLFFVCSSCLLLFGFSLLHCCFFVSLFVCCFYCLFYFILYFIVSFLKCVFA